MRFETRMTEEGIDKYLFLDASELHAAVVKYDAHLAGRNQGAWAGGTLRDLTHKVRLGDESLVAESVAYLEQIESQVPMSRGWVNVDDVVGAVPNIPAFLAGHPQHMRRRMKVSRDNAPLAIYMDLTSSGGITADDVQRRGVVLLALTRMLVEHRAVELWVGASLGSSSYRSECMAGTVAWRIDTAPLDLARAAYHIGSTAMSRLFGYGLARGVLGTGGHWPFANYSKHVETAERRLRSVMDWGEVMYIPPIYLNDPMTDDPVGWLKRVMRQYVPTQEDE